MPHILKQFKDIKTGEHFIYGGADWIKKSTRTAHIDSKDYPKVFYFGFKECVSVKSK